MIIQHIQTDLHKIRQLLTECENFNYIKIGSYVKKLGGLDHPGTNQRLYEVIGGALKNIKSRFWGKVWNI